MVKRKSNCIYNKSLVCCAPKPNMNIKNKKSNFKMQMMFFLILNANISPMNSFKIVILGYYIQFFGLVAFIGL